MIYGWLYRSLMKLAHRFDWHYAPVHGPISGGDRPYQRWCQWCGLRQSYSYDPRKPIPGPLTTGRHICECQIESRHTICFCAVCGKRYPNKEYVQAWASPEQLPGLPTKCSHATRETYGDCACGKAGLTE